MTFTPTHPDELPTGPPPPQGYDPDATQPHDLRAISGQVMPAADGPNYFQEAPPADDQSDASYPQLQQTDWSQASRFPLPPVETNRFWTKGGAIVAVAALAVTSAVTVSLAWNSRGGKSKPRSAAVSSPNPGQAPSSASASAEADNPANHFVPYNTSLLTPESLQTSDPLLDYVKDYPQANAQVVADNFHNIALAILSGREELLQTAFGQTDPSQQLPVGFAQNCLALMNQVAPAVQNDPSLIQSFEFAPTKIEQITPGDSNSGWRVYFTQTFNGTTQRYRMIVNTYEADDSFEGTKFQAIQSTGPQLPQNVAPNHLVSEGTARNFGPAGLRALTALASR